LNVAKECDNYHPKDFKYMKIELEDWEHQRVNHHLEDAFNFVETIRNQGGKCLVHCFGGVSRSPTVTIAYCMKFKKWNLRNSYDHVKNSRDIIQPNEGFIKQLIELERELYGEASVKVGDFSYDSD